MMNRKQRRKYRWTKKEADEKEIAFKMVGLAELYIQKPDDPIFKNFRNIEKIKLLAEELKRQRKAGKLK